MNPYEIYIYPGSCKMVHTNRMVRRKRRGGRGESCQEKRDAGTKVVEEGASGGRREWRNRKRRRVEGYEIFCFGP